MSQVACVGEKQKKACRIWLYCLWEQRSRGHDLIGAAIGGKWSVHPRLPGMRLVAPILFNFTGNPFLPPLDQSAFNPLSSSLPPNYCNF